MTLDLCNGIIVPEAAAMLDDTELEIIDSAHEVKSRRKIFLKKYRGTGSGIKKYSCILVHGTAHLWDMVRIMVSQSMPLANQ